MMRTLPILIAAGLIGMSMTFVVGQSADTKPTQADKQGQAADRKGTQSGKGVVDDLLKKRTPRVIQPTKKVTPTQVPADVPEIDPRVVGTAPGARAPKLRGEGEFIINRRGRLIRAADGAHFLYAFDADSKASPEPPMVMMPCQMLESMEKLVQERGDKIVFNVSGQIFVYKGANYLLPSIMRIAPDKGNLQR